MGVGGEGEEAEVQARVRRELRRRAYRKVLRKEEEREAGVAGRVKEILGRFDKRAWEWEDEMRQKLEHVRKIEKANDMMEKALGSTGHEPEGKGAGQFSGEFGGILEILEEEAQRDGEIMSEEQWIATIRPSSASGADSAASDGTEDDKRARSASKTRG